MEAKAKRASWIKNTVQSFSIPGDVGREFCASTCSTAKKSVLLDHHRTFSGSDVDFELLKAKMAELLIELVSQVLDPSDVSGSRELKAAAKAFKDKTATLGASEKASLLEVPHGKDAAHTMSGHTLHFISIVVRE